MDKRNLARALSVGADLRTRDRAKLSIAQIDHLALMDEIERLARELSDSDRELKVQARLAIQRRRALEQIRDYHVIQGMSPALFAEKVLGSSDSAGESNGSGN